MVVKQQVVKSVDEGKSNLVLRIMRDRDFLYESLPFVVGVEDGRIKLRFFKVVV